MKILASNGKNTFKIEQPFIKDFDWKHLNELLYNAFPEPFKTLTLSNSIRLIYNQPITNFYFQISW